VPVFGRFPANKLVNICTSALLMKMASLLPGLKKKKNFVPFSKETLIRSEMGKTYDRRRFPSPHHRGWRPPYAADLQRLTSAPLLLLPLSQLASHPESPVQTPGAATFILSLLRHPGQEVTLFLSTGTNGQGPLSAAADELRLSFVKTTLIRAAWGTAVHTF
jgi:hypothetical protein